MRIQKLNDFLVITIFLLFTACSATNHELVLVKNGKPNSVVVVPNNLNHLQKLAVDDFCEIILKSSDAKIPVVPFDEIARVDKKKVIILVANNCDLTQIGLENETLQPEEFHIYSKGNYLVINAEDIIHTIAPNNIWNSKESGNSRVTQWAIGYLLDKYVGVRWLWPGELGTHIPKQKTISIPEIDIRLQQPLIKRCFNVVEENHKNLLWLGYHNFTGQRENYHFRHSFRESTDNGDWWEEFNQTRPELLAKAPDGKIRQPKRKGFFKVCISNPEVSDEIIKRWEAAGKPNFWDITPNDGNGFCTCDNCIALDKKYGNKIYTKEEVWNRPDYVGLTDRYVWFWNQLILKMREKNPKVKVGVFLYSAYRDPPKKLKVEKGIVGEIVHGFDFSYWKGWQKAGIEEIGLRPNWLYMGASGPHLPLSKVGNYVENARKHGMVLIDMDCFHEYWATQGAYYYLLGRLVARPDLNTETIIKEYCSAFGEASEEIRNYLSFWESYHKKVAYNIPAGGKLSQDPNGLYETICRQEWGSSLHPLKGHWQTQPLIYNDSILNLAKEILYKAEKVAKDKTVLKRIDFLSDGLKMVEKSAAYMKAYNNKNETVKMKTANALIEFNENMNRKYDYWHSKDIFFLKYWGLMGKEIDSSEM